ncbi:MAG: hypothetical protein HFE41_04225 [Clostridia bacterium]|nr:hypothetical protein [Clostridia bacterium]
MCNNCNHCNHCNDCNRHCCCGILNLLFGCNCGCNNRCGCGRCGNGRNNDCGCRNNDCDCGCGRSNREGRNGCGCNNGCYNCCHNRNNHNCGYIDSYYAAQYCLNTNCCGRDDWFSYHTSGCGCNRF